MDDLTAYASESCHIEQLEPAIRAFYEDTQSQVLLIYPEWHWLFRWPARLYKILSRRVGQMNLPLHPDTAESLIRSDIVPLSDSLDGRQNVRGWIRVYEVTQEAVYVAAYATHFDDDAAYMSIAFPFPFGNLSSILYLVTFGDDNKVNLRLSSFPEINPGGHQGVYFSTRWFGLRLPFNEIIEVFPAPYDNLPKNVPVDDHEIFARHRVWLFGFRFLTLHYGIHRSENIPSDGQL